MGDGPVLNCRAWALRGYTEWYGNMPLEAPAVSKEEESARREARDAPTKI